MYESHLTSMSITTTTFVDNKAMIWMLVLVGPSISVALQAI